MTGRPPPTADILVHFCIDGDAVLMRRDREALIFIGVCEVCDGHGRNCQLCGWEHAGGPLCAECLELLQ